MTTEALQLPVAVLPEIDDRADIRRLMPEGTEPPAGIPSPVFDLAVDTFLHGRRLDMQSLAGELGFSRSTLYRRVGHRDRLLGAVIWYLTRKLIVPALEATAHLRGKERIVAANRQFMFAVAGQPALRALLEAEPEAALRILTSKHGPIQGQLVALTQRLLAQEEERGNLTLAVDRRTLAYVMVRIGESFLYADVIADNEPDVTLAAELIGRLLPDQAVAA